VVGEEVEEVVVGITSPMRGKRQYSMLLAQGPRVMKIVVRQARSTRWRARTMTSSCWPPQVVVEVAEESEEVVEADVVVATVGHL
jgi:hypothetical protein